MATKRKTVKKAPAKKALDIKDGSIIAFISNGFQQITEVSVKTDEDDKEYLSVELNYLYENDSYMDGGYYFNTTNRSIQQELEDDGAKDIKILTKAEATKLVKELENSHFRAAGHNVVPRIVDGEPGFRFGCGSVELTAKQVQNYLTIRKTLISAVSKKKEYKDYLYVAEEMHNEDVVVYDKEVLGLCKRFGIK